jgi:alpha-tubulin suppressor-like RCC1 family protein
VTGGITNWTQVSAGREHSLGVTNSGIAYAWGAGGSGRLGDGTTTYQLSPVTVVGGITNWAQVSAGDFHSLGVTDSGIAYAWGQNDFFGPIGQLGTGTTINQSSPVTVVGGITNWAQVSAGSFHSLGVTDDGIAYAWGAGESGRLGTGTTTYQSSPVTVIGGITNWAQVSGGQHSLGITDTGIAYAWGQGNYGRLGTSDIISRSSPVTVVGGITNWLQADSGDLQHMVAIREQ